MNILKSRYSRNYDELERVASKFWPSELSELEAELSAIPLLLNTQEQFISIIGVDTPDLERLFQVVDASSLPANLFLKHLVLLADVGGEPLKRISREFRLLFPDGKLHYFRNGNALSYTFQALPEEKFSNTKLHIDGRYLAEAHALDNLKKDAIALLLFGSTHSNDEDAGQGGGKSAESILVKCEIGDYVGKAEELALFIKQRYIWVSQITRGAKANNLGQLAQKFVADYIVDHLDLEGVEVRPSGRLPNISHTDALTGRDTSFDIVVTNGEKFVAVEVSFQVTTNSVIERKAGQAKSRYDQAVAAGHRIAYVIDGSGNFERETALRTILAHSHCSVAFSRSELDVLCQYLREIFTY